MQITVKINVFDNIYIYIYISCLCALCVLCFHILTDDALSIIIG